MGARWPSWAVEGARKPAALVPPKEFEREAYAVDLMRTPVPR
jgi:hypothetical protein